MSNAPGSSSPKPSDGFVVLGTIVRPHGLKGEVKISLSCSGIDRLVSCESLRLVKDGKELKQVSVIRSFSHSDGDVVLRLKEVKGVEEAESLRGAQLAVLAKDMAELPAGSYYSDDLLGLKVLTVDGIDLGRVEEVMDELANAVCVVRGDGKETLIPLLRSVVREVDLNGRRMVVELPEVIDGDAQD